MNKFPITVTLNGAETSVSVGTDFCCVKNCGTDTLYASAYPNIVPDSDGVLPIEPKESAVLPLELGKNSVYLLGNGKALVIGNSNGIHFFESAAAGGSAVDSIARDSISTHAANSDIHHGISELSALFSNPNFCLNPDFRINQRGSTSYSGVGSTVDRWATTTDWSVVTPQENGVKLSLNSTGSGLQLCQIVQEIEDYAYLAGKTVTFSLKISELTSVGNQFFLSYLDENNVRQFTARIAAKTEPGVYSATAQLPAKIKGLEIWLYGVDMRVSGESADNYAVFEWVKLELGSAATAFVPADTATELMKCQRYYQVRSTGNIDERDLRPSMRTTPTVNQRADGSYEYIAD